MTRYSEAGQEIHGQAAGSVMTVEFELDGQPFTALNGGPVFKFNEAISLQVFCDTQDEIDHYWEKLSDGGDPKAQQCGWLKDKFGLSWQVVPRGMAEMLKDPASEGREAGDGSRPEDEEARHRRAPEGVRGVTLGPGLGSIMNRRDALRVGLAAGITGLVRQPLRAEDDKPRVMTVRGPIPPEEMGPTLPHEHVLVDFVGAKEASRDRYDADEVYRIALPHLKRIRRAGHPHAGRLHARPIWAGTRPCCAACPSRAA